ncbi:uncharacterized protein LOC130928374 isoform X3 [Corythoichthys intestinalis]|uniref:uncharacterized protein LOC130928374 isoform X3 n=1 Tax=Corythoichthys intestinalis TaxID=161448 RepID=UPI0025A518EB|nr:uncharacterized protein LOC130928374 isoform X3 [Corythoichthys intestinalis]
MDGHKECDVHTSTLATERDVNAPVWNLARTSQAGSITNKPGEALPGPPGPSSILNFRKSPGPGQQEPESPGIKEEVELPQIKEEEPEPPQQQKREAQLPIKKEEVELPYVKEEEEEQDITRSTGPTII